MSFLGVLIVLLILLDILVFMILFVLLVVFVLPDQANHWGAYSTYAYLYWMSFLGVLTVLLVSLVLFVLPDRANHWEAWSTRASVRRPSYDFRLSPQEYQATVESFHLPVFSWRKK